MYEHHFGLSKPPFRITPDPAFFFAGGNRGAVLEALVYAISRGEGIIKVVGEVGSGKTMLCRMLERELPPNCEKIYLANPRLGADDILHAIAFELGLTVSPTDSKLKVMHLLHDYLLRRHAENLRVIMFVEEAQSMPLETLEEIRLLSNLETTSDKLLQIVLFGQPELDEKLDSHAIRQLRERITHSFELAPLVRGAVRDYVLARLRASGYRGNELFEPAAVAELTRYSSGLLRRVNVLADKALLAAFAANASTVGAAHVRRAARDSEFARPRASPARTALSALLLALVVVAGLGWWLSSGREIFPYTSVTQSPGVQDAPGVARLETDASVESEGEMRASGAVSAAPAIVAGGKRDNQALLPRVSPHSGLVGSSHLQPLLEGPPTAVEIEAILDPQTE